MKIEKETRVREENRNIVREKTTKILEDAKENEDEKELKKSLDEKRYKKEKIKKCLMPTAYDQNGPVSMLPKERVHRIHCCRQVQKIDRVHEPLYLLAGKERQERITAQVK